MGKIRASLADISTDFEVIEPGTYELEITKVVEKEKDHQCVGYMVTNKVVSGGSEAMQGKTFRDYLSIVTNKGESNTIGLGQLKRYFEVVYGIEEVSGPQDPTTKKRSGGWEDDDFDTDKLIGKRFRGQVAVGSFVPAGKTDAVPSNELKAMESL